VVRGKTLGGALPPDSEASQKVAVIGAGRVGTAMAVLLSSRGFEVTAVADTSRAARARAAGLSGARPCELNEEAAGLADIIIITVPDASIEEVCAALADSGAPLEGKKVVHMSGALSLSALASAAREGAETLSIHPIQTFADLEGAEKSLPGSTFGVTCDESSLDWATGFVSSLDGRTILIAEEDKVAYHAAATVACNLFAMVEYGALAIARELGFSDDDQREAFAPLISATAQNVTRIGPVASLTGPLARGDVDTVRAHIRALDEMGAGLADMYRSVCILGLDMIRESGGCDEETIRALREALG
jgi:predicted short-subunit dehydrogenase-like oxidoreductase (DUF2520 family)